MAEAIQASSSTRFIWRTVTQRLFFAFWNERCQCPMAMKFSASINNNSNNTEMSTKFGLIPSSFIFEPNHFNFISSNFLNCFVVVKFAKTWTVDIPKDNNGDPLPCTPWSTRFSKMMQPNLDFLGKLTWCFLIYRTRCHRRVEESKNWRFVLIFNEKLLANFTYLV